MVSNLIIFINFYTPELRDRYSAVRFGNLESVGLLFEPFGNHYFDLATSIFGYFLFYFTKIVKKTV